MISKKTKRPFSDSSVFIYLHNLDAKEICCNTCIISLAYCDEIENFESLYHFIVLVLL